MPTNGTTQPIVVSEHAGAIDTLTAAGRYIVVIFTVFPALIALLKTKDFAGLIEFLRGNQGAALGAAAVGLGTLAYGLIKTRKRGAQLVVAADAAPNSVAKVTD
jgi:hypothetical protein